MTITLRQSSLLQCLVDGMTLAQAAKHLGMTERTARRLRQRAYDDLGVKNRYDVQGLGLRRSPLATA